MARGPRSENPPCPPLTPSSCLTGQQAMPSLAAIKSLPATVSSTSHLPPSPSRSLAAWHSSGQGGPIDQMSARGGTGKVQAAARRVSARLSLPCPALWLEPARTFLAWRRRRNVWRKPLAGAAAADYSSWHSRPQPASHHPPPLKSRNNNHSA